jgi:hypothetical protein
MPNIAIIDDRQQMRQSIRGHIELDLEELGQTWGVIDSAPLPRIDDYRAWIQENDVSVLILDENLDEDFDGGEAVAYFGHNVAEKLRTQLPDLPQFIVTSIKQTENLDAAGAALDAIIKRDDFGNRSRVYVERMVRAGLAFVDRNENDLAELSSLVEAMVLGTSRPYDRVRIDALRQKLSMDRDVSMDTLKELSDQVISVRDEIQQLVTALRKNKQ